MRNIWVLFLAWLVKLFLGLRYRIRVKGLELLEGALLHKKGGVIFLPNHPAELDPVMVEAVLWRFFQPRPLIVEHFYYLKGYHYFMKLIGALALPDLQGRANRWKQSQVEKVFQEVKQKLLKKENFMIYPSGKLRGSGEEEIGGASFVYNLAQACSGASFVLVRTTGLWGSRFSKALTGKSPDFGKVIWEGLKIVLKNGIFFIPKRDVLIEMEVAPSSLFLKANKLEFNQALEAWYNSRGKEPLTLVSDCFWKESFPEIKPLTTTEEKKEVISVSPKVEKEVIAKIAQLARQEESKITRNSSLSKDLGLDSLDILQLHTFLEESYDLENVTQEDLESVEDALKVIGNKKRKEKEVLSSLPGWEHEGFRKMPEAPLGSTLQEAFLRVCDKMDRAFACADEIQGPLTYRRLKLVAIILSKRMAKIEGSRIGILLPSTSAAYILIFAILLAGKIPVMLNWTIGRKGLEDCVKIAGVSTVFSSRKFLNQLTYGDLGSVQEHLILMEDVKQQISLWDKIKGFLSLLKEANSLLKSSTLKGIQEKDTAVILFTSGTENVPKGVPLSHKNILSNQKSSFGCLNFFASDVFLGVLPPFHSFGFSATGIFPILTGIRVFYSPDPTESRTIAREVARWKATFFVSAPTFIQALFQVAHPSQLDSLRFIVAGAEKTPEEVFDYVKKLEGHKEFLEGYGVTECSPIVTLSRAGSGRKGVGLPIPGVKVCILNLEKETVLPQGEEGEICISGPSVFEGYLGIKKDPFVTVEGEKWYRSGDLGFVDKEGYLHISGRLKRFTKIGGEMVSLGGLEEELLRFAKELKWGPALPQGLKGPPLAVAVLEKENEKPQIILFTVFDISREAVNLALRESGYGRIVKIAEVRKIKEIPLTGTGKVHYRGLADIL